MSLIIAQVSVRFISWCKL